MTSHAAADTPSLSPASVPASPLLKIETLDLALAGRRRPVTVPLSVGLHAVGLLAVVVVPLLMPEEPPTPSTAVKAFFVEPAAVAPPPPPPPPPAPAARSTAPRPTAPDPTPKAFTAPVVEPEDVPVDELADLGLEGGVPGGVAGGVPGGVVGGVVGGLPTEPPPPVAPVRVGGDIREPKKVKHVVPEYPEMAKHARVSGVVVIEALIGTDGRVKEAKVLRSVPLLDAPALAAVRQWAYTPTLINGVPVPLLMTVTLNFNLRTM